MKIPPKAVKMCRNAVLRYGAVMGVVYYFKQAGVWDGPEETELIYEKFKAKLEPHADKLLERFPDEMAMLSKVGDLGKDLLVFYNNGVKETFQFIEEIPSHTGDLAQKALEVYRDKREKIIQFAYEKQKKMLKENEERKLHVDGVNEKAIAISDDDNGDESKALQTDGGLDLEKSGTKQHLLIMATCL